MGTNNYNLPLVSGTASAKVPRDLNALSEATDATIKSEVQKIESKFEELNNLPPKPDFLNFIKRGRPVFYAHRGASTSAPENTIPAFQLAGEFGFSGIETDIWRTTDGVWVCMHDETVDRMTNGTGTTETLTSAYISSLTIDAGSNVTLYDALKVPTLQEYLTVCKTYSCTPVIEVKGTNTIPYLAELIEILKASGVYDTVQLEFGDQTTASAFRQLDKKIILHLLTGTTQAAVDFIATLGNTIAGMVHTAATESVVNLFHQNGIPVSTFGISNMGHVNTQIKNNVDILMTDVHGGDVR